MWNAGAVAAFRIDVGGSTRSCPAMPKPAYDPVEIAAMGFGVLLVVALAFIF